MLTVTLTMVLAVQKLASYEDGVLKEGSPPSNSNNHTEKHCFSATTK